MNRPIVVVPDSNLLFGHLSRGRPDGHWQRLLGLSAGGDIRLVLPEIVQWELVNQLREALKKKLHAHRVATERLRSAGLTPAAFGEGSTQVHEIVADESERLRQEVLWNAGEIRAVPNVDHADLVRRSLERRPPFDSSDKGYRDALLWHTVLDLTRQGSDVILASNDARAFSADKGGAGLHPVLVHEVEAMCGDSDRVRLVRSLGQAIELLCERTDQARADAQRILGDEEVVAEVMKRLVEEADEEIIEERELHAQGWPEDLVGVRVLDIRNLGGLSVESAVRRADETLVVEISLRTLAELDVRSIDGLEYNDAEALIDTGYVSDYGVGLLDGLHQMYLTRDIELLGELILTPDNDMPLCSVELRAVRIPRREPGCGQLRLEILPLNFQ